MATRKILEFGKDDMLRKRSRQVDKFDRRLWMLLDDMADTLYEADGAGLAAVQVGVLRRCVVIDVGEPKKTVKEDLDAFIDKLTDHEGVNVIFEAAGVPALMAHAVEQLSPAGRLVAMTFGKEPIPVNFKELNAKELTILGTRHQYQKFPETIENLPGRLDRVHKLVTHVFPASEYKKAFETLEDKNSGAGKVILTFDS